MIKVVTLRQNLKVIKIQKYILIKIEFNKAYGSNPPLRTIETSELLFMALK